MSRTFFGIYILASIWSYGLFAVKLLRCTKHSDNNRTLRLTMGRRRLSDWDRLQCGLSQVALEDYSVPCPFQLVRSEWIMALSRSFNSHVLTALELKANNVCQQLFQIFISLIQSLICLVIGSICTRHYFHRLKWHRQLICNHA